MSMYSVRTIVPATRKLLRPQFQKQVFLESPKRSKGALKNQLVVRPQWRRLLENSASQPGLSRNHTLLLPDVAIDGKKTVLQGGFAARWNDCPGNGSSQPLYDV